MLFFCVLFTGVMLFTLIPQVVDFSQILSMKMPNMLVINITAFLTQNGVNNNFFDTAAQVLAAILAIIFSISLFVIERSSEKYTLKITKYYGESRWTKWAFGTGVFTILVCLICIYYNVQSNVIGALVLLLLIVNCFLIYFYYNYMKEIIDPYKIADLLKAECINAIKEEKKEIFQDIIASFADMVIKAINDKDAALSFKYIQTIKSINYDIFESRLSPSQKNDLREIVFNEVARALRHSIDNNDESRLFLNGILFEAIQLEVCR